jgi:lauroyl/myristoyl acyltransferase
MNEQSPPATAPLNFSARGVWDEMKDFVHREPLTAIAAVATVGLLIKLLPNRWLVTTGSVVGAALVRPAILSLAVTKAMEMCFPPASQQPPQS